MWASAAIVFTASFRVWTAPRLTARRDAESLRSVPGLTFLSGESSEQPAKAASLGSPGGGQGGLPQEVRGGSAPAGGFVLNPFRGSWEACVRDFVR